MGGPAKTAGKAKLDSSNAVPSVTTRYMAREADTRTTAADSALTTAMIEEAGHEGLTLVFRSWTVDDMQAYAKQLPDIAWGVGGVSSTAVSAFCKEVLPSGPEMRKTLALHMGPTNFEKIKDKINGDFHPKHPVFENATNTPYSEALEKLCEDIKRTFPCKVNTAKIRACKQQKDEVVMIITQGS